MRVPPELLEYKQWVLWRRAENNGRVTRVPISPWSGKAAACDKRQTWGTYRHVLYALRRFPCDGIGFVFTDADPFCGIDLDQCRAVNGTITSDVLEMIRLFGSYTELSPSGTGVHILIKAKLPGKGRRTGKIEIYDTGRYFTVTGKHVSGTPFAIQSRQEAMERLATELFPVASSPQTVVATNVDLSDEQIIERATNARNGDRFMQLWAGDASDYGNDRSRADLGLCSILAFWCGGDSKRIDRLFRRSGLMREKWDRRTGDSVYGALTIRTAVTGGRHASRVPESQ
jgi:primase-polymerase (primpol)-like protein